MGRPESGSEMRENVSFISERLGRRVGPREPSMAHAQHAAHKGVKTTRCEELFVPTTASLSAGSHVTVMCEVDSFARASIY